MEESANTVFLSLVGSGLLVLLAFAYIGIWCLDRSRQALLVFAAMCVAILLGETVWILGDPDHTTAAGFVRIALHTLGVVLLCEGVLRRRMSRPVHLIAASGIVAIALLAVLFCIYVAENAAMRNFVQSAACGAALSVTWWQIRAAPQSRFVEELLAWLLALLGLAFLIDAALWTGELLAVLSAYDLELLHQIVRSAMLANGAGLAVTILVATITEIVETLRQERDVDPLTGVFNRRGFDAHAATAFSREAVAGLVLVDLDHFKRINDQYGHGVGDDVLGRVGAALRGVANGRCTIGRIGGEEFAVLLVGCTLREVSEFAELLRVSIAGVSIAVGSVHIGVTASLGVATRKHDDSLRAMIARADARLYAAKSRGRNRLVSVESTADNVTNVGPALCDGLQVSSLKWPLYG
ncbi:GGDEF domain-containing protein [Aquamicrobium sp. NLF2-7]|uniref:GGDEF domain-containing protein n=1 Tax=Aquamicrobium sp. NLF2-7 TaxID=2918753 RepID=UPI001EFA5EE1|nr:GGDEF domain-containing protein [Aquamicrobium sp. NLF2-7]MCG8273890.1 GGDEF domain-containing protein [Aquamicrobium sp. NLF2-7]